MTHPPASGPMVRILTLEWQKYGFDSNSRHNISHFHHPHDTGAVTRILYKLQAVWLLNLSIACMCAIVSIKNLKIPGGRVWQQSALTSEARSCIHTCRSGYNGDIREHMWCNGSALAGNARDVGSIHTLGTIFPIFISRKWQKSGFEYRSSQYPSLC